MESTVLLVFFSVTLLVATLLSLSFSEERRVKRSLRNLSEYESAEALEAEPLLKPFRSRVLGGAAVFAAGKAASLLPAEAVRAMRTKLARAGRAAASPTTWILAKPAAAIGVAAVFGLAALPRHLPLGKTLFLGGTLAALAYLLPGVWLDSKVESRRKLIRKSLPEMLDMLTISAEAGLGFDTALAKLISNSVGPLAEEFAATLQEIQAGVPRREALKALSDRVGIPEFGAFIMAVVQADVFGVSIAHVLKTQSRELRTKRRQRAEEMAQKIPVKIVFPVVLCILPATMLVILGPAAIGIARMFGFGG